MSPEPGRVPTDAQILALHRQHAPTPVAFELVYTHCRIVCAIAEQLLRRRAHTLDADLVRAGCLLHDVGVYRLGQDRYLRHGVLGDQLLREAGWPERLARFCRVVRFAARREKFGEPDLAPLVDHYGHALA